MVAVIAVAIHAAETEARVEERQRLTADWLTEIMPADIIHRAAEKVTARQF
jgi:hypothetical protein